MLFSKISVHSAKELNPTSTVAQTIQSTEETNAKTMIGMILREKEDNLILELLGGGIMLDD